MPSLPEPRIYAPIEDLDPEPVGPGRRLRRREVALGMLLLVGVLLFAGWDWQRQEGQATAYRAGEQAALAREWDAAEAAFRSVGTYRDAAQRAAQAAATQAERDRRYAAAQSALGAGDYLGALAAVEAVAQVQPGYRDTAALAEQARAPLLRAVLSGTVAQRPAAQPPGLYRYGAAGWEWLAGSDAASQVQATGAPGYVLYDGPNPDLPRAGARVLVRADLQRDPAETATFTLNPADFSGYRVGADGVWGIRDSHLRAPALASVQGYGNLDLTYQATADPRFQALILPGPDWLVLDLAPDGRHYLLADLSRATGGDAPTSLLYLAGGASRPQALYAVPGLLRRAQFSPDGRWVLLVSTQAQAGGSGDVQTVQLLDRVQLAGRAVLDPAAVHTLLRQAGGTAGEPSVGATFLADGPRAGQIVLMRGTAEGRQISLADPATPGAAPIPLWTQPGPGGAPLWVRPGGNGGLVFGWHGVADYGPDGAFIYVNAHNRAVTLRPQLPGQTLGTAWLVGDYLVYETSGWPGIDSATFRSVYSLPLGGLVGERPIQRHFGSALPRGGAIPDPTPLYTGGLAALARYGTGEPVALGTPWLGTIPGGTLRLRSVDGTQGVPLADGIVGLYPVAAPFAPEAVRTVP
jgi:hypothetical protein